MSIFPIRKDTTATRDSSRSPFVSLRNITLYLNLQSILSSVQLPHLTISDLPRYTVPLRTNFLVRPALWKPLLLGPRMGLALHETTEGLTVPM